MQEEEGREDRLTLSPVPISCKGIRVANSRIGSDQIRGGLNQDDADGHAKWMVKRSHRSTLHQDYRRPRELGTGGGGPPQSVQCQMAQS